MVELYTILIACYDKKECTTLQRIFTGRMFQTCVAQDIYEVVNAIERHNPALLVIDIGFPETQISGWEVVRDIRQRARPVPLIFLLICSGHNYKYLEPEYKSLYDHILILPADVEEFWQGAKKLLGVYPWGKEWDSRAAKQHLEQLK